LRILETSKAAHNDPRARFSPLPPSSFRLIFPEAPMFQYSDFAVVRDVFKIVPQLIEELKAK
jgi:hypothetical protein